MVEYSTHTISIEKCNKGYVVDDNEDDPIVCETLEDAFDLIKQIFE